MATIVNIDVMLARRKMSVTELAEKLSHPHTLVYTICHARGFMDLFRRRCEDTSSYAGLVISTCNVNGFSHWLNCGVILDGWAAVCAGHLDRGMAVLREGIVRWQEEGAQIWMPMFRIVEAETYVKAGRDEAALLAIEQALAEAENIGERWATAEALAEDLRRFLHGQQIEMNRRGFRGWAGRWFGVGA